ncbi:hypothetical protein WN48_06081 [Eufriesea mexicana]|nr:hypothetical protein WN48_06081 [Eufriesea mexicana]
MEIEESTKEDVVENTENVNSFLKVDNVLFALVRDLSGNDPAVQLCAIGCSCNIALGNTKACTSLTKSIGSYLVTELNTLNYPLLEVCIWTIGNLIAGSNKAFEIFHAQGCLKYIISLMHNCDSIIMPAIAYTAMQYIHIGFRYIQEDEMIELVTATTKRNISFENSYIIWLLALLSSQISCNKYLYNTIPIIVDYLYQNVTNNFTAITEITACIRILANTVQEASEQVAKLLLENPKYSQSDLEILLNRLLSCNLYNHNSANIKKVIRDIISQSSFLNQTILSTIQQYR